MAGFEREGTQYHMGSPPRVKLTFVSKQDYPLLIYTQTFLCLSVKITFSINVFLNYLDQDKTIVYYQDAKIYKLELKWVRYPLFRFIESIRRY